MPDSQIKMPVSNNIPLSNRAKSSDLFIRFGPRWIGSNESGGGGESSSVSAADSRGALISDQSTAMAMAMTKAND